MAKNRHIPRATAGRKSHSLRAVVLTAALLACVTAAVQPAQAQTATYAVVDGTAREPAVAGGLSDEGEFTITLSGLNQVQEDADNVAFFFIFTMGPEPAAPSFGVTPGYGPVDNSVTNPTLATRQEAGNDFKFILDYRPQGRRTIREFANSSSGYTNEGNRAPVVAPTGAGRYIYTFRVVPLHDNNDNEGMEFLLFGFRVFFSGAGNANDLTGRVNGGTPDTAITIVEPLPTAEYTLIDGDAHEPAFEGGIANEGEFTITLARLDSFQSEITRNLEFFFRFARISGGQTNGYDPIDASLIVRPIGRENDVDFILEYTDVTSTPVVITDFSIGADGNYSNDATAPRAMVNDDGDEVYTFRVVPRHDNDDDRIGDGTVISDEPGEELPFGYRVQFTGDTNNEHDLHGRVNGVEHRVPIVINEPPPPAAEYALIDGDANEPATASGIANEGKFTITLSGLDESRRDADSLSFFFRFTTSPGSGTAGYGTIDSSVTGTLATRNNSVNDFEFILEYTDVNDTPVVITDFTDSNGNYSNNNTTRATPRAMVNNDGDEVYTFRVVPLHDNSDDEGVESLLFGYRVQFNGINNSNDLQGSVNGGVPDTPVVIGEPLPIVTYAVVDGIAHEPDTEDRIADEGEFTITLSHLNEFQMNALNLAFFFRFTGEPRDPNPGFTPGYGDRGPGITDTEVLATRNDSGLDFEFILEYTVNGATVTKNFDPALGVYSNSSALNRVSTPRATINGGDEVYTFRVVPLHDTDDDEDVESLLFGYRVSFDGDSDHQNELRGAVNGGEGGTAITIAQLPAAEYTLRDGDANEPATASGIANEGRFTINLSNLDESRREADSLSFFFRFAASTENSTTGYGTIDDSVTNPTLATRDTNRNDFEFILEYTDVNDTPVVITDFTDSNGNYSNDNTTRASPRAMVNNDGDEVYTFRVVPLHDTDDSMDGESLLFGYRVQFNGIDRSNDLQGRVNGGTPDTPVVIGEPLPTASYAVVDGTANEPATAGGITNEGKFTITLSHLNATQMGASNLAFFFRFAGSNQSGTPGYGTADATVTNPTLATINTQGADFDFILEYTDVTNTSVTRSFRNDGGVYSTENLSNNRAPRAMVNNGNEVYTFRVVPLHDNDDDEGMEFLLFGFRVLFDGTNITHHLTGMVNGGNRDTAIIIDDPLPTAEYTLRDGDAREPAIEGGFADEGEFTITLDHLNSDQEAADVAFFFRFVATPDPSPGQTNGFGTLDPNLSSTKHATISGGDDDFEFILDYRDVDNDRIVITDFRTDSDGNYNNNASPAPRAMDDVYTFRVVPKHDNDNDNGPDGEILVFGYRVQFNDIDNSNDLHGRVNGTPDTPVVINEPLPTASYAVVDGAANEPDTEDGIATNEGRFTITLSHLNEFQTNAPNLAFFFRLANNTHAGTLGYGTRDASITNPTLATINSQGADFEFILDYTDVGGEPTTRSFVNNGGIYSTENAGERAPRAMDDVYPVRVVPLYDNDDEGAESLLFGFRVFFSGDSSNTHKLEGRVNGGTPDTAITINDPGIRLRIRTFLEGALQ